MIVKNTVNICGGNRVPTLMGRGYLPQKFFRGRNYIEIDTDIAFSRIQKMICGTVIKYQRNLIIDECFLLEGAKIKDEDADKFYDGGNEGQRLDTTLPERLLCLSRFYNVNMQKCAMVLD